MACNSCFKAFSIFRQEKGCPNCGFSYCSKCLNYKIFVKKLNEERKVCLKCSRQSMNKSDKVHVIPHDSYNRHNVPSMDNSSTSKQNDYIETNRTDHEIEERLKKLKQCSSSNNKSSDKDIAERLERLKGKNESSSDVKTHPKMANAGSSSVTVMNVKPKRSEQEDVNDLLVELEEKSKIDSKYSKDFENKLNEIEMRLQKLRSSNPNEKLDVQVPKSDKQDNEQTSPTQILGKPIKTELRTEQEELNDLLKQLEEESKIEADYDNDFIMKLNDLEMRLNNLKKFRPSTDLDGKKLKSNSIDEEKTVLREIFAKLQTQTPCKDPDEMSLDVNDELPFCEICNEDAKVRCKGCKYLFCMRCFNEHKDEDCYEYEVYYPSK